MIELSVNNILKNALVLLGVHSFVSGLAKFSKLIDGAIKKSCSKFVSSAAGLATKSSNNVYFSKPPRKAFDNVLIRVFL